MTVVCCEWMSAQPLHEVAGKELLDSFSYHHAFIHFHTVKHSLPPENKQQQLTAKQKQTPLPYTKPPQRQRKEGKTRTGNQNLKKTIKTWPPKRKRQGYNHGEEKGWEILLLMAVLVLMLTMLHDNFISPLRKVHGMPYNVLYNKTLNQHVLTLPPPHPPSWWSYRVCLCLAWMRFHRSKSFQKL